MPYHHLHRIYGLRIEHTKHKAKENQKMASSSASTSATLTLSSIHLPQEPKSSLISSFSFKPNPKTKTLVLHSQSECIRPTNLKSSFGSFTSSKNSPFLVSAVAAEADLGEVDEDVEGGSVATAPPPSPSKPKKGKAALPLKSDRVCLCSIQFYFTL